MKADNKWGGLMTPLEQAYEYKKVLAKQGFKICNFRWINAEKKWQKIRKQYSYINIYGIIFAAIGDTTARLFAAYQEHKNDTPQVLNVYIPVFQYIRNDSYDYSGGICNRGIFKIFSDRIYIVTGKDVYFWTYVLKFHHFEINTKDFYRYRFFQPVKVNVEIRKPLIPFSKKDDKLGKEKALRIGINKEYICIHARDNLGMSGELSSKIISEYRIRNCDINSFQAACDYVHKNGMQIVRMGKYEKSDCKILNVIDYSNKFYNEFMDFYLVAKCKFILGSESGLSVIAGFWGVPMLITNVIYPAAGREGLPVTGYDLYIPKKLWSGRKKRYLNLYEVLDMNDRCNMFRSYYETARISFIDNTQEEILEATMEMDMKINGVWVVSEDEAECREKYWKIINKWKENHSKLRWYQINGKNLGYQMLPFEISYNYLKKNRYLLDVDI